MESQLKPQQQNDPAFVLGNGVSRLNVNPTELIPRGTVYGCNAQYREFAPHHLVAVDVKMVNEIIAAGYQTHILYGLILTKVLHLKQILTFLARIKGGAVVLQHYILLLRKVISTFIYLVLTIRV